MGREPQQASTRTCRFVKGRHSAEPHQPTKTWCVVGSPHLITAGTLECCSCCYLASNQLTWEADTVA
eukprot:scaffold19162_cov15-Tisochrysis_lutea.AAC.1